MVSRRRKILTVLLCVGFSLLWVALLLLPVVKRAEGSGEEYLCRWENGSETRESFSSAYAAVAEFKPERIVLIRDGITGEIVLSECYAAHYETLLRGSANEALALDVSVTDTLERIALWERFSDRAWWNGAEFVVRTKTGAQTKASVRCRELVIENDGLTAKKLQATQADAVEVRGANFSAKLLVGTKVTKLTGAAPYFAADDVLFLQTMGGVRLVACLPETLAFAGAEYDFADDGALIACDKIRSLRLPFAGNSRYTEIENYRPEVAVLFLDGDEYFVPSTLKRVEITGGAIAETAFYGCENVEEISLCGIKAENVSRTAFSGLTELRTLHVPTEVPLGGAFICRKLGCGCFLYQKEAA